MSFTQVTSGEKTKKFSPVLRPKNLVWRGTEKQDKTKIVFFLNGSFGSDTRYMKVPYGETLKTYPFYNFESNSYVSKDCATFYLNETGLYSLEMEQEMYNHLRPSGT